MIKLVGVFSLKGKDVLNGHDLQKKILSSQILGFVIITWNWVFGSYSQRFWFNTTEVQPEHFHWQDPRCCWCCFRHLTLRTITLACWNKKHSAPSLSDYYFQRTCFSTAQFLAHLLTDVYCSWRLYSKLFIAVSQPVDSFGELIFLAPVCFFVEV